MRSRERADGASGLVCAGRARRRVGFDWRSSLRKTWERWVSTVRREMYSRAPISGFVSPSATRRDASSVGVSDAQPNVGRASRTAPRRTEPSQPVVGAGGVAGARRGRRECPPPHEVGRSPRPSYPPRRALLQHPRAPRAPADEVSSGTATASSIKSPLRSTSPRQRCAAPIALATGVRQEPPRGRRATSWAKSEVSASTARRTARATRDDPRSSGCSPSSPTKVIKAKAPSTSLASATKRLDLEERCQRRVALSSVPTAPGPSPRERRVA